LYLENDAIYSAVMYLLSGASFSKHPSAF